MTQSQPRNHNHTTADTVCAMEGATVFCEVLKSDSDLGAILNDESEKNTLFVPTDAAFAKISTAFEKLSDEEAGRVIMFHMYKLMLTSNQLECGEKIISMNENGDTSRTKCSDDNKYQNGNGNTKTGTLPQIASADTMACNGVIHTLDAVMIPVSLSQLESDSSASASASASSDTTTTTGSSMSKDIDMKQVYFTAQTTPCVEGGDVTSETTLFIPQWTGLSTVAAPNDVVCFVGSTTKLEADIESVYGGGSGTDCSATNACLVHVHAGTSCESEETQGLCKNKNNETIIACSCSF